MIRNGLFTAAVSSLLLTGCGLEGLLNLYGGNQYTQPLSIIRGSVALADPTITLFNASREEVTPYGLTVAGGSYEIQLISGNYSGLMVRAEQGQGILEAFVPALEPEVTLEGVNLDLRSTETVKIVQGLVGVGNKSLPGLSDDLICIMGKKVNAGIDRAGPVSDVFHMMERVLGKANLESTSATRVFSRPEVTPAYVVDESALSFDWISRNPFDYDADGSLNQNSAVFDAAYVAALQELPLVAPANPQAMRVVFSVNFNAGQLNGACGQIDRFRWVRNEPGRQMFFVGGIHQTSPVQSTTVDAMLGNRGGWTPNQIPMYDDGTHGDQNAGDNIWSIYFDLPPNVRIGYKYTWGSQGDLWTGTEEWPGNQRILEVVDNNNDAYVYRADNFGDEATNKDLANGNPASGGSLDWVEDLNGDGFPEAQEGLVDIDNDCGPDEFVTPEWVPALTVSCEDFVAE